MLSISPQILSQIAKTSEVAYQYGDGLIEFTYLNKSRRKTRHVVADIAKANQCVLVRKDDENRVGFDELYEWSIPSDVLIKVDDFMLICLPGDCEEVGLLNIKR